MAKVLHSKVPARARDKCHTIFVQRHSTGYNQPLDVSYFRAFKASMRRAVAEWTQDVLNRANPEGQLPVNVPELELNFVALVNAAMHQLSNGGDQPWLEGWKHLLPDSEEEFVDVLEIAKILHAKDELLCGRAAFRAAGRRDRC